MTIKYCNITHVLWVNDAQKVGEKKSDEIKISFSIYHERQINFYLKIKYYEKAKNKQCKKNCYADFS